MDAQQKSVVDSSLVSKEGSTAMARVSVKRYFRSRVLRVDHARHVYESHSSAAFVWMPRTWLALDEAQKGVAFGQDFQEKDCFFFES